MKVSELTGAQLDYLVAKAEGIPEDSPLRSIAIAVGSIDSYYPQYSSDWSHGGPIIEMTRMQIAPTLGVNRPSFLPAPKQVDDQWCANINSGKAYFGETPLIAAMRAYVASKFGDEVPDSTLIESSSQPDHSETSSQK